MAKELTLKDAGYALCRTCGKMNRRELLITGGGTSPCPRCGTSVHSRAPGSISRTWAFVITGFLLLIPANVLPFGEAIYFGSGNPDTIISGIAKLMKDDMVPIAILVFIASVIVPLFKLTGLTYLLLAVHFRWKMNKRQCTAMHRLISIIGRWSMLDLFLLSILVAMVDMGAVASVTPGPGATFFATVVVITVFAATSFDSRLIWDLKENLE